MPDDECRPRRLRRDEQGVARCRAADRRARHCRPCRPRRSTGRRRGRANTASPAPSSAPVSTPCSTRPSPTWCSTSWFPPPGAMVALSAFAHDCHLLTRKAAGRQSSRMRAPSSQAARKAGRVHAVVQNRRYLAGVRRIRRFLDFGAIGEPTSIHCRLLPRAAFRRLSRGDGACAAARHGDPHLRRRPLHGRPASRPASIARNGSRPIPGTGTAPRPAPSSISAAAWSSPIAAAGAPTASADQLGRQLAHRRRARHADLGRRRRAEGRGGRRRRTRRPVRPDRAGRSARRSTRADRIGGHLGVIRISSHAVETGTAAGDARRRQHQEPGHGVRRRSRAPRPGAASTSQI